MKKTLVALLVLCSVAAYAEETPFAVWTAQDLSLSGHTYYTIDSDEAITTSAGMTAYLTIDWTGMGNAPALWFCTTSGTGYTNSAVTMGYQAGARHATLFNLSGSSTATPNEYVNDDHELKTPDFTTVAMNNNNTSSFSFEQPITYFLTTQDGVSQLYTLMDDGEIQLIASRDGMKEGTIDQLYIGHRNNANTREESADSWNPSAAREN